jgi:hypothetical protein
MNYKQIKEALEYGSRVNGGRAALFAEGRNTAKWEEIRTSPFYKEMLQEVIEAGEKLLEEPIEVLPFSKFKIFDETGSRKEFERAYFRRRLRLNTFAILSMLFDDTKYVQALEDAIWAICDEYTWCLPAHLAGTSNQVIENVNGHVPNTGGIRQQVKEHRHVVDLFAAETGFALSELLSMLEDRLSGLVVYRARKEVRERILEPYCELNSSFHWETATMNWASVCAGGVGASAMYLIEDDAALAPIVQRLMATMDCFLSGFEDDGACTEGLGYWNYGFGFFVYFARLLEQRTGGRINLMHDGKVKEIALFQQKCYLSENYIVPFSDSFLTFRFNLGLAVFLKDTYSEVEVPDRRYSSNLYDDHCYRWAHTIRNFIWSSTDCESAPLGDAFYHLKDSQFFISRKKTGEKIVSFAAKGGHNNEPHNHNDVGNFILHVGGETLLTDTGAGEYTKAYFREQRYSFVSNGSQGHSVPIIEGEYQKPGREHEAAVLDVESSEKQDRIVLDIGGAYGNSNLQSLKRDLTFIKAEGTTLLLKDEFQFAQTPSSIVERFVSFHKPVLSEPGVITIRGNKSGNRVEISYDANQFSAGVQREAFVNHFAVTEDLYLINLEVKTPGSNEKVEISFHVAEA